MNSSTIQIFVAMIIYFIIVVGVGLVYAKRSNKNSAEYYLGGRSLGPFVTAMSAEASDMSGWLLMGLPAVALVTGLAEASWTAIGLAIGTYINWLIVAKNLRIYTEKLNAYTLPDFFSKRFGDNKNIISTLAALIIIVFFIPYTASGFAACGKLFASLFGMKYITAMVISAVVIILYCTLGGFLAASTTDFIQSIIMTIALFVVLGFGEGLMHGFGNIFNSVAGMDGYLDLFKGYDVVSKTTGSYGALPVVSTLAWGLGYFGMPHILLRFMAIKDENKLKLSRRVATVWVIFSMAVAVIIGVVGYNLMLKGIVPNYGSKSEAETIIVDVAKYLSKFGFIPSLTAGVILAGILASTMSTADSQLLAAASGISENIFQGTFKIKLSEKQSVWLARISVVVISVIAIFLASNPDSSVFSIVSFAWAGFGAAFGPLVLFALFWKRTTKEGAFAGMLSGGIMVFVWKFVIAKLGGVFAIYELLPAFLTSCIFIIVVSLLTKKPSTEITDIYNSVKAKK